MLRMSVIQSSLILIVYSNYFSLNLRLVWRIKKYFFIFQVSTFRFFAKFIPSLGVSLEQLRGRQYIEHFNP